MNPLEPFGIVFCEALANGCNVVTQSTSGIMGSLFGKRYFHVADCICGKDLANRLLEIAPCFSEISGEERQSIAERFSYKSVADEYKKLATPNVSIEKEDLSLLGLK